MNLLAQIVVTYFPSSVLIRSEKEKENSFPEIFGILSTANKHVCPAVPATIVIYCAMEEFDGNSAPWNQKLEKQVWDENIGEFNAAVSWVSANLSGSLNPLCGKWMDEIETRPIAKKYLQEHEKIKIEIHKSPQESLRVTNF